MLTAAVTLAGMFGLGVASAWVPVVNAELALGATAAVSAPPLALGAALVIAAGQTVGKIVIFEAARAGGARWRRFRPAPAERPGRWRARLTAPARGRRPAAATVVLAASVGLPPPALVSAAAGAARMRRVDFAVCCLLGRTARFCVLALAVVMAR